MIHPGGVEILLVASFYENHDTLSGAVMDY